MLRRQLGGATVLIENIATDERRTGMKDTAGTMMPNKRVDNLIERMMPIISGLANMGEEALATLAKGRTRSL